VQTIKIYLDALDLKLTKRRSIDEDSAI
jgi:hypothetical protein